MLVHLMELKNKTMEKLFVPYKQALELKELGFNDECLAIWAIDYPYDDKPWLKYIDRLETIDDVKAPIYKQAFGFLLDKCVNYSIIIHDKDIYSLSTISKCDWCSVNPIDYIMQGSEFACLKGLIKIIKSL